MGVGVECYPLVCLALFRVIYFELSALQNEIM